MGFCCVISSSIVVSVNVMGVVSVVGSSVVGCWVFDVVCVMVCVNKFIIVVRL